MSSFFPNFIQMLSKFYPNSILKLHKLTWTSLIISIKKMLLMARYLLVKLQPKISLNHNVQSQTNQKIDRQVRLCYFDDTAKVCKTSCISCFQILRMKREDKGGFHLEFVNISQVINNLTCDKFECSH